MTFIQIVLIAFGLSLDAFAVAVGIGASGSSSRGDFYRLPFSFGLFQFIMPVIGWYVGYQIQPIVAHFDHWIAFGLLVFIGIRMIRAGLEKDSRSKVSVSASGLTLLMLSVATSIDALAVGLSLAMLEVQILYPSMIIGIVTYIVTLFGVLIGNKLSDIFARRMEILGGIILILIGVRIVIEHLT